MSDHQTTDHQTSVLGTTDDPMGPMQTVPTQTSRNPQLYGQMGSWRESNRIRASPSPDTVTDLAVRSGSGNCLATDTRFRGNPLPGLLLQPGPSLVDGIRRGHVDQNSTSPVTGSTPAGTSTCGPMFISSLIFFSSSSARSGLARR